MPESLNDKRARQAAAREALALELDVEPAAITSADRAAATVECGLCDDDGYRGSTVCDHIDHQAQTVTGRAAVQAELAKIRARRNAS